MVSIDMNIIDRSIETFGETVQLVVCMEEMAELTQAISKYIRGKRNRSNEVEEIADVFICLGIVMEALHITIDEVDEIVKKKQERIARRIEEREGNE